MRFHRLMMEVGTSTVTIDFHPRLTVVAGVGALERESLVTELLGALGGSRPGTHLQVVDDTGRRLGILHPVNNQPDRVVELESHQDVTGEFVDDAGEVDVLGTLGLDVPRARKLTRFSAEDLASEAKVDRTVVALAAHDQTRLWQAADRVRASKAALEGEVAAAGADPVDTPLVEEIEVRHAVFEAAQQKLERTRHFGIVVGGACVLAAGPAVFMHSIASIPFLLIAVITTLLSIVNRRRMERAGKAERAALDAAGAESYLAFRLQRVNGIVDDGANRQRLSMAVAEHRNALGSWRILAGDVSVEWADDMRDKILATAERLRAAGVAGDAAGADALPVEPAELAQALILRLNHLRHAGRGGESLPLLMDDPLLRVSPSTKQWLLELLGRSAGTPQVIYLTADPDVAAWARMEAVGGELNIIEPAPENEPISLG